jgi:FkbM family methyltransferase
VRSPGEREALAIEGRSQMLLKSALVKLSGNGVVQTLLEKTVQASQYLMGIGSGTDVLFSGEEAIFYVLKQRLKPPYCIFDVGSNKGQFLRLALDSMSGDDISIHCFEPSHNTFKLLVESSQGDQRVKLNNVGIGKEQGHAVLHSNGIGSGLASLTKRRLDHFGIEFNESETVELSTIDHYCSASGISHIHLLKIDIEGHELDALAGARQMFETKSIDIVTFEFGGCNIDTRTFFQDFWYFFTEHNMAIYRITPSRYLYRIESYKEIHEQFRTMNFIATSNA